MDDPHTSPSTLSIIIPAFSEGRRLGRSLERIREYAVRRAARVEVIVVDDGSTDATAEVARQFAADPLNMIVLANETNRGKGYSVRRGMLAASGSLLVMCDADLSAPIEEVDRLLPWLDRGYDIVIGSRDLPESRPVAPRHRLRRLLGRLFAEVRRLCLLRQIRDTQCPLKVFRRDAARRVFSAQTIEGFAFDCEVLGLACKMGYKTREVGIAWHGSAAGRVRLVSDGIQMLLSLPVIWWRVRRQGT